MDQVTTHTPASSRTPPSRTRTRRRVVALVGLLLVGAALLLYGISDPAPLAYLLGVAGLASVAWPAALLAGRTRGAVAVAISVAVVVATAAVVVPAVAARPTATGVLWRHDVSDAGRPTSVTVVGDALVLGTQDDATIVDAATGEVRATIPTPGSGEAREVFAVGDQYVLVSAGATTGLYAVADGRAAWTVPTGDQVAVAAADQTVALASVATGLLTVRDVTGATPWGSDERAVLPFRGGSPNGVWTSQGLPAVVLTTSADGNRRHTLDASTGATLEDRAYQDVRPLVLADDLVVWVSNGGSVCTWSGVRAGAAVWSDEHPCEQRADWTGRTRALVGSPADGFQVLDLATGSLTDLPATARYTGYSDLAMTISDDLVLAPTEPGGAVQVATDPPTVDALWTRRARVDLGRAYSPGTPLDEGAAALLTTPGPANPFVSYETRHERFDVAVLDAATGEQTGALTGGSVVAAWGTAPGQALVLTAATDEAWTVQLIGRAA